MCGSRRASISPCTDLAPTGRRALTPMGTDPARDQTQQPTHEHNDREQRSTLRETWTPGVTGTSNADWTNTDWRSRCGLPDSERRRHPKSTDLDCPKTAPPEIPRSLATRTWVTRSKTWWFSGSKTADGRTLPNSLCRFRQLESKRPENGEFRGSNPTPSPKAVK